MKLKLPPDQIVLLNTALRKAKFREIGGQIYGEQIEPSNFRITELTFQKRPGTFARFIVDLAQAARDSLKFFEKTGHNYIRYNYIGEWHSHPSFDVRPSGTDVNSMIDIVTDQEFKGSFAVLMITRLVNEQLTCGAWVFDRTGRAIDVKIEVEHE